MAGLRRARPATNTRWRATTSVALALAGLTLVAAWLRETPLFWRNAGGYPLWVRAAVRAGFLPLACVDLTLAWHLLAWAARAWARGRRLPSTRSAAILCVLALDVAALIVVGMR
jgi:hypothetical protein